MIIITINSAQISKKLLAVKDMEVQMMRDIQKL